MNRVKVVFIPLNMSGKDRDMHKVGTIVEMREYGKVNTNKVKVVESVYWAGNIHSEFIGEFLPPHRFAGQRIALNYRDVVTVVSTREG